MSKAVAFPGLVFLSLPKKMAHIRRRSGQSYMQLKKSKNNNNEKGIKNNLP